MTRPLLLVYLVAALILAGNLPLARDQCQLLQGLGFVWANGECLIPGEPLVLDNGLVATNEK